MIGRRTCLWVVCLLSAPTLVSASEEDLRLINAAATQDKVAVRALLNEGVNVNVARADGVTAFLYAVRSPAAGQRLRERGGRPWRHGARSGLRERQRQHGREAVEGRGQREHG